MERMTHLKDGSCIGIAAIEIETIPASANLDEDPNVALKKNVSMYAEMLQMAAQGASLQDTVIELLCVTVPISGQTYVAQPKLFLVFRKFGRDQELIRKKLHAIAGNCFASLQASAYIVKRTENSWNALQEALNGIQEETLISIEKKVRIGTLPGQMGYMCYTNIYKQDGVQNFSRVYEAITHYPGLVLSFQLIPTNFAQNEARFIQGVISYLDMLSQPRQPPMQMNYATEYYRNTLEVMDKSQYLCNIIIAGSTEGTMLVSGRLRSILQREDNAVSVAIIDRTENLLNYAHNFAMFPWNLIAYKTQHPEKPEITPVHFRRMVHMVSVAEALTFFHTPIDEGTLTGFAVNRTCMSRETFSKGVIDESSIQLGRLIGAWSNTVPFGAPQNNFGCPEKTFTKHALVVGTPGSGKTTFSVNLLLQFARRGIPFLAIEPTKTEYRAMIDAIPDLQIFTPGNNSVSPYIINPFIPPRGIRVEQYISSLASAFKAAFSMPSPLDMIFLKAARTCYIKYGWKDYSKAGDADVTLFGLHEFILEFKKLLENTNYSKEVRGNLESAGLLRLTNLIEQNGNIYDTINTVPIEDLLRTPTVLELNAIDNAEQKALIMALLLINICIYTKHNQVGDGKLKNAILIDEAHVLLRGRTSESADGSPDSQATTIKALQDMIAEIRSYGTSIIIADQSPTKVGREVVANTDIKVSFRLVQAAEKELIADSTNMNEDAQNNLSRLTPGEAYVYYSKLNTPQMVMTEDIRAKERIRLSVPDAEVVARSTYWKRHAELLKPYVECGMCRLCEKFCDFNIRSNAEFIANSAFNRFRNSIKDTDTFKKCIFYLPRLMQDDLSHFVGDDLKKIQICSRIKLMRKIELELSVSMSDEDKKKVITHFTKENEKEKEDKANV